MATPESARWRRPDVDPQFDPATSSLAFQWTAIDMMGGEPLKQHPGGASRRVPGASAGPVPIIRFFGVNESGNSVACFVHGFTPYTFAILPREYQPGPDFRQPKAIRQARFSVTVSLQ